MNIIEQLVRARKQRGISAAEVALRAGIQRSNLSAIERGRRDCTVSTLEKLAAGAGLRLVVTDLGGRPLVSETARSIGRYVAECNEAAAYRALLQLNNDLASAGPSEAEVLANVEPDPISPEWDAAVAGLVEWRLADIGASLPAWTSRKVRNAAIHWAPWSEIRVVEPDPAEVPEPLRRRGVYLEKGELASA